jgi:hypothetical protein
MPYLPVSGEHALTWQYYAPDTQFYPYESRKRWFRTFNDDYLLTNYSDRRIKLAPYEEAFENAIDLAVIPRGGPMHPTAEGHAHIADAVVRVVRAKIHLPAPDLH